MEKLMDLIKANDTCTLATCSDNKPRASIMAYMVIEDQIIFATGADSIKGKNLLANPQVSLSISALPLYTTIDGTLVEPSEPEKQAYNEKLFIKYPEFKELMTKYAGEIADKVDVILFAQGSMAYCEEYIHEKYQKMVLSSPRFGARALKEAIIKKGIK